MCSTFGLRHSKLETSQLFFFSLPYSGEEYFLWDSVLSYDDVLFLLSPDVLLQLFVDDCSLLVAASECRCVGLVSEFDAFQSRFVRSELFN